MTTLLKLASSLIILTGPPHLEAKTQTRSDLSGSLSKQPLQPLNTVSSSLELQVHNEEVICSYHMHGLHQRPDIGSGASSGPRCSASTASAILPQPLLVLLLHDHRVQGKSFQSEEQQQQSRVYIYIRFALIIPNYINMALECTLLLCIVGLQLTTLLQTSTVDAQRFYAKLYSEAQLITLDLIVYSNLA